jgi:hypothetical protein
MRLQMEKMIERQKQELLKHGAQDLEDEDEAWVNSRKQRKALSKKKMIVWTTGT